MSRPVDDLRQLQTAIDHLAEAQDTLENLPPAMRDLHQRYSERKAEIDGIRERIESANLERRSAEAESSDWQTKLARLQSQIAAVKTQREYGAILSEIDQATEHKEEAEATALEAMEQIETAEGELTELEEDFAELASEYEQAEAEWQQDKPGVEERAAQLRDRVATLRAEVPRPVLARYERVLDHTAGRAMSAVVPVDRGKGSSLWACSHCSYRVRPQAVVEIRSQGKVLQCEGCRRFLYVDETAAEEDAS